jgi:ABC-type polysaccharide/polyol phosphate export permease
VIGVDLRVNDPGVYDSTQCRPPILDELFQVLRYRDLLVQLVRRDIVTRYKRSVLGVAWTMLNPLGMMLVLTIAFSQVFGTTRAYAVYVLTGLVAWNFFAQTSVLAMRQFQLGGTLLHRIYLPRTIFSISAVGTGLVNLVLSLVPILVVMLVLEVPVRPAAMFLPVSILLMAAFALGIGLLLSATAAYFWDVSEIYEIALSAWMFLTPVIYPEEIIPESLQSWLFNLNPMYHLVKLFRSALYYGTVPDWTNLIYASVGAVGVLLTGWTVFTSKSDEFAYRI